MDEAARLYAVEGLDLPSILSPDAFAAIATLTARMLRCPVAAITVVGGDANLFLAESGLGLTETPRAGSFCSACIEQGKPLIVSDALSDPQFRDHDLVARSPSLSSYIGVPLQLKRGLPLGTLCAMSPEPNAFSPAQIADLALLALLAEKGLFAHVNGLDLMRANASLREFNRLFKQAEEAAQIGSWRFDLETEELTWSRQVYAIHGVSPDAHVDKHNALLFYVPEDREAVQEAMANARQSGAPFRYEASIQRPDGQIRRVRAMGERIEIGGQPTSMAGVFLDCTEDYLKTAALQRAAEKDCLTGLYNRAAFDARLAVELGRIDDAPVILMLLDLDGFKEVNDTLGHLIGDRLLASIAERLRQKAGEDVFVARWGGDEFAFLFGSGVGLDQARQVGERLVKTVQDELLVGDKATVVGATAGLAAMSGPASTEELVRRADTALYFGKEEARGSVQVWSEAIDARHVARQRAMIQVRTALTVGGAYAVYQPIVELASGRVRGLEALLRLKDEQGATLTASMVLPALIDPQISRRVSKFMLDSVLQDSPELVGRFGSDCTIGINVSEADLRPIPGEEGFVEYLLRRVARSGLRPANLTLEVTETMLLLDSGGHIRDSLCRLDQAGFIVALDDFGTGFSSLTHLRDFPIRKVKIDRAFVQAIASDHQSRLIIQAIVQLGRSLDVDVVAEGVENETQETFLCSTGCRFAQGYHFGMPQCVDAWKQQDALGRHRRNG
jgi:diguanylate cyclase (GGDEF)-like protein/PAS domain S-box-containing protein